MKPVAPKFGSTKAPKKIRMPTKSQDSMAAKKGGSEPIKTDRGDFKFKTHNMPKGTC